MTIEQTVEIPANHRLVIDVPRDIPAGEVKLIFIPPEQKATGETDKTLQRKEEMKLLKQALEEIRNGTAHTPHADALKGILSGLGDVDLEEARMKRLAKHLK